MQSPLRRQSRRQSPFARFRVRAVRLGSCALLLGALGCAGARPFTPVPDPVSVRVGTIDSDELRASLDPLPNDLDARVRRLAELFRDAGCGDSLRIVGDRAEVPDVICERRGEERYAIVVTANLDPQRDRVGRGENWTAVAMLPQLYRAIAVEPRGHSYLFIGLGNTRYREYPAKRYLGDLAETDRARIRGMVNLEALGLSTTAIWSEGADRNLRQDLFGVAKALEMPLRETVFSRENSSNFPPARISSVPAITLHSLDRRNARLISRPLENQVDSRAYGDSARTLAVYLAYLDDTLRIRAERAGEPRESGY